jgi:hypothetical protein
MHIIRQFLGNHNPTHTPASASSLSSPATHQRQPPEQKQPSGTHKRGKSYGGGYAWGRGGEQPVDDNSSTTTGITEFSRSMSRDTYLPLHHDDIREESNSSSNIYKISTVNDGIRNLHIRPRSSSLDAKKSLHFSSAHQLSSDHQHRSRSSNRRKKKNKDKGTTAGDQKNNMLNLAPKSSAHAIAPPQPHNDTIEFIDLKDPAPTTPTTTAKEEENSEVEEYVMELLEEYQHEIKRLERLNTTLTANLETLTAAALLNGEENNTAPVTAPQNCPNCSHCSHSGAGGSISAGSTSSLTGEPLTSSSNNDIYNDMILTETHYLSKISKLQKSNHKLTSELEHKKKLISQLLLNLSTAADKIKELSSSHPCVSDDHEKVGGVYGGERSTHDCASSANDADGGRNANDVASSMKQIHQYQIQVVENELQSLLQVMNYRSTLHAQRRHTLIDEYRHGGDSGNDGRHKTMGQKRLDETPEEILHRVIRNLRSGGDEEVIGQQTDWTTSTTEELQQEKEEATLHPPSPVATLMLANEASSSLNSGGVTNIWDSVTSLFYSPGQPKHTEVLPQRHDQLQLQPKEVVPSLEIQAHPLCDEIRSFDKSCLRKVPSEGCVEERSRNNSIDVKEVECSAKSTVAPISTHSSADSFGSCDDVSQNLALMLCQKDIDDVDKAANVDCKTKSIDDASAGVDKPDDDSLGKEASLESNIGVSTSIGFFAAEGEIENAGELTEEYPSAKAQEIDDGKTVVRAYADSSDVEDNSVIERTSISKQCMVDDIEDTPSGLTRSETLLEGIIKNDACKDSKIHNSYATELDIPSHDEDETADVYTAKEPKDEGESVEQECLRSGDVEDGNDECIVENNPIAQALAKDDGDVAVFESSYIGMVSLSNLNSAPVGNVTQEDVTCTEEHKDDKPDKGSTFEENLLQLASSTDRDVRTSSSESMTISSTVPATTLTSESENSITSSIDPSAVNRVEKMVVGNKTLCETLGTIQGKRKARLDGSVDDRSMLYHNSIASFYRKPSATISYGDDSLSIRFGRRHLFQHQGSLDLSDIQPDVYGDWQILVKSTDNDKYFVPRYKTPVLPPQSINRAVPLFKKGLHDGHYRYASSSGNEYSGHWVDGKRHGYGMAKYHDGEVYHGQWRRGRRHGHGVLHLSNHEVFDGYWSANKKHGLGMYFWTDGEVDISWYQDDVRLESLRWTSDRRRAYRLDLASSKKQQISLARAADIVREWERKRETDVD